MQNELKRKTIELAEIGPEFCLDILYANEAYDEPFVIETKNGEIATVNLYWAQGHGTNYYFDGLSGVFYLSDIAYIEVR